MLHTPKGDVLKNHNLADATLTVAGKSLPVAYEIVG